MAFVNEKLVPLTKNWPVCEDTAAVLVLRLIGCRPWVLASRTGKCRSGRSGL